MTAVVIALSLSQLSTDSGAAGTAAGPSAPGRTLSDLTVARVAAPVCPPGSKPAGKGCIDRHPVALVRCPSVAKAIAFYSRRVAYWRDKMGAGESRPPKTTGSPCARYLAHVLQRKAYGLRRAYGRYVSYHYHWWKWMPAKLQRVGACETGYGRRPGNFHWDSGTYVSFAGIIRGGYAEFAHALGLRSWDESRRELGRDPTPREQVLVTLALQARYGWGAWGCGGA